MGIFIKAAATIAGVAVLIKVGNPLLDKLILPQEETAANIPTFDPNQTNVLGYTELGFVKPQVEVLELNIGITFILAQSFPKWFTYLIDTYYTGSDDFMKNPNKNMYETVPVDILDARLRDDLTFAESGFTLLQMDAPSKTKNWRSSTDIRLFQDEIRPLILKLYPGATRIEFTHNIVRGGNKLGDQPAAINGPHLDYSQDDKARQEFHEEHPINEAVKEHIALFGKWDTDIDEVRALVGIWKPIHMNNPVYDHPLAIMDARTFDKEQERPHRLHFDFGLFKLHNLNGAFTHDKKQRWYYYSFQEDTEVLVFTQYTKGKHFCNPHSSFLNPNRPSDDSFDSRQSVELRAAVFFPKRPRNSTSETATANTKIS